MTSMPNLNALPEPEQAEIDAYMDEDNAGDDKPTDAQHLIFCREQYEQIRSGYTLLLMQLRQMEATKNDEGLNAISKVFKNNYKARKYFVTELRKMGEKVDDKIIPLSAV